MINELGFTLILLNRFPLEIEKVIVDQQTTTIFDISQKQPT